MTDFIDPYSPETANLRYPTEHDGYIPLLDAMIEQIMTTDERHPFLQFVRGVETGDKIVDGVPMYPSGQSHLVSDTDAKGVYQFQPSTVVSAKERANQIGVSDEWISGVSDNPAEWNDQQADIMFLLNLFPRSIRKNERTVVSKEWGRPGMVDELLKSALLDEDRGAMEELYYTLHHGSQPKLYKKLGYRRISHDTYDRVRSMNMPEWDLDVDSFLEPLLQSLEK